MRGDAVMAGTRVSFPVESGTLRGYLVQPEGPGPFPAIVVVHEIFGLSDNIRRRGAPHRPEQGRRGRTSGRSSTPWRRRSRLRECRESRWKTPSGTSGDEPAGHEEPRQLFVNFLATCRRLRELGQRKKAL